MKLFHKSTVSPECKCVLCHYLASTDVVVLLLHNLLDRSLVFICDEYESPPLFRLWILRKLDGLDLQQKEKQTFEAADIQDLLEYIVKSVESVTSP